MIHYYYSFYLQIKTYKFMYKIRIEALRRKGARGEEEISKRREWNGREE
jgi:hypothetical protein